MTNLTEETEERRRMGRMPPSLLLRLMPLTMRPQFPLPLALPLLLVDSSSNHSPPSPKQTTPARKMTTTRTMKTATSLRLPPPVPR